MRVPRPVTTAQEKQVEGRPGASAALGCPLTALPRAAHLTSPDQSVGCGPRLLTLQHFRARSFSHKAERKTLTKAPFISLKTTPLKTKAVWGSAGSSCSSRHPSCLREDRRLQRQRLWGQVHARPGRHLPEVQLPQAGEEGRIQVHGQQVLEVPGVLRGERVHGVVAGWG